MSLSNDTVMRIKAQLDCAKQGDSDLQTHLTQVLSRIVQYHQKDAYEKFEDISALVKRTHMSFCDPKKDKDLNDHRNQHDNAQVNAHNEWVNKCRDLLNEVSIQLVLKC